MAEPARGWTTRELELGGTLVPRDEPVWIHGRTASWVEIEHRGRRGRVTIDAVSAEPFRGPSVEELRALDACFGLPSEAFEREHLDRDNYFEIRRCRAHGRRFLWDVVGPHWSDRTTLLTDEDPGEPLAAWRYFHAQSSAWHARHGRTLES